MAQVHEPVSAKSYGVAVCLAGVFGVLGIHHFYLGRPVIGLIDLAMSVGAFFFLFVTEQPVLGVVLLLADVVHSFVVTIMLLVGAYRDGDGAVVAYPGQFKGR